MTGRLAFLLSGMIDLAVLGRYLARQRAARRRAMTTLLVLLGCGAFVGSAALAGATAPSARADTTEPSILMDDYAFIYSSAGGVERNLEQVAALGVNTVKVSMVWSLVAPDPNARTKPNFDASDPAAYPAGAWTRYDRLVQEAHALGMNVYFQLTAPAPLWAVNPRVTGKQHPWSHEPNAADFEQFVEAVGQRYSGQYPVSDSGAPSSPGAAAGVLGTLPDPFGTTTTASTPPPTIGAVHMWGIWNEPNEVGWVSPQRVRVGHRSVLAAPQIYRRLVNAGYRALLASGHGEDTILIGETASGGAIHTLPFLDALFCVNAGAKPLTGAAARREGCPASGDPQQFIESNPGLFGATGWAHHPYSFNHTPSTPFRTAPSTITLANLGVLERGLDRVYGTYGEPSGLPVYVTEWGYKTDPPDPYVKTSLGEQETWLDDGWYMSYLMPRVKAMAQELLYDQPPIAGKKPGTPAYWSNFDSGLEFHNGHPKPAYDAFRLPIWVPDPHAGAHVRLWAEIRPAGVGENPTAVLEYLAPHQSNWTTLGRVSTSSPEGFIYTRVAIPHPGRIRLAWADVATQQVYDSRSVTIN